MKIGLLGFGKAGKSVASVILQNEYFSLEWIYRQRPLLENKSGSEFLGIESNEPGIIFSSSQISIADLLEKHPVDFIIDFSTSSFINTYGKIATAKKIKIISAISHYKKEEYPC